MTTTFCFGQSYTLKTNHLYETTTAISPLECDYPRPIKLCERYVFYGYTHYYITIAPEDKGVYKVFFTARDGSSDIPLIMYIATGDEIEMLGRAENGNYRRFIYKVTSIDRRQMTIKMLSPVNPLEKR